MLFRSPDDLGLGGKWDVGTNGRLLPTTSVDQYMAELALWLGVSKTDLAAVFPNIGNFYDVGSAALPVGFMRP